jgi:hypothetical protein
MVKIFNALFEAQGLKGSNGSWNHLVKAVCWYGVSTCANMASILRMSEGSYPKGEASWDWVFEALV